jgi:hypothetical protein
MASSKKQMDDYKSKQMSKYRKQELENLRLLDEATKQKVLSLQILTFQLRENINIATLGYLVCFYHMFSLIHF